MKRVRTRLTYANVMSSIAVFLVIAGGSALAATQLGKNTVGTKQLKKEAVTLAKIKQGAKNSLKGATGPQGPEGPKGAKGDPGLSNGPAGGVLTGNYPNPGLAANAVTGANIQQGTLDKVKAGNVYGVTYAETGTGAPKLINASDPGIKAGGCFLVCSVEFPVDVSQCSYTASSTFTSGGSGEPAMAETFPGGSPNTVLVVMWNDEGNLTAHDFAMTVVCPTTS